MRGPLRWICLALLGGIVVALGIAGATTVQQARRARVALRNPVAVTSPSIDAPDPTDELATQLQDVSPARRKEAARRIGALVPVCQTAAHGDTKATSGFASDPLQDVLLESLQAVPPGDGFEWLDTVRPSFGVQVGERSDGKAFVIVITASTGINESEVVTFVDEDDNSLPEQATRTSVATVLSSGLTFAALHEASGTLYVIDAKNNRVLRFADSDSNKIPNGTHSVFASASQTLFTVTGLEDPTEWSVKLTGNSKRHDVLQRNRVATADDTDSDGVANSVVEAALSKVTFMGSGIAGEADVEVYCDSAGQYEIVAVSATATTQLATFTDAGLQVITCSRAPLSGERLQIRDVPMSTVLATTHVVAANITQIYGIKAGPIADGGVFDLAGRAITGLEVVQAIVASSTTGVWSACSIESSTTATLECELPDLQLTKKTAVLIRVFKDEAADDPIFVRRVYVYPGES